MLEPDLADFVCVGCGKGVLHVSIILYIIVRTCTYNIRTVYNIRIYVFACRAIEVNYI